MRYLPPIETAVGPAFLPLADTSAEAIACALLAANNDAATRLLGNALSADPPLAVWVFCRAGKRAAGGFESIDDLAAWLLDRALEVLHWPESVPKVSPPADRLRSLLVEGAATSALAADRAADAAIRPKAALRGLVCAAPRWLLLGLGDTVASADRPLSWVETLVNQRDAAAKAAGAAAAEWANLAAGGERSERMAAIFTAADALADRWLADGGPVAGCLPALVARLRRAQELETRFEAAVEAEKIEAMAEFAAGAGHEINNPLGVIAGRAQLLLRDEADPQRRKELALINAQAMRVFEMIADMRLFARPPKPELAPVDLSALAAQVVGELADEAARREIELAYVTPKAPPVLVADATQLAVALRAIVQNALEAVGASGRVAVSLLWDEESCRLSVADNGPGLVPEERRHIFDAYYSARQAGRGLGLGLCKAWTIAKGHGGRIDVASEPGQGATFTLVLGR